jgi:DNA-directed RNA polymerase sigma subunit (sigma70/sigma32)
MSDYAISVKVRNGRIRRKIAECGFSSVNELCRKFGLPPHQIGALLNLKLSPLKVSGRWRHSAATLAEALGCTCEELFSEAQRTLALRDNRGECFITENRLLKLSSRVERPLLENPEEQLLEDVDEQAKTKVIRRALDALKLSAWDREIIERHFGIGCEPRTLADLALEQDVSPQCVENRLHKTLWRLRAGKFATRRSLFQAYQPAYAMGRADETRVFLARRRVAAPAAEKNTRAIRRMPQSQ